MTDQNITDSQQRAQALDPAQSFIVQAPAGSGKTELLTQRYLRLLALVEHPEEIAAITFTRKAAAEMRNRVLAAIDSAAQEEPAEPHRKTTWQLACAVAGRSAAQGWQLRDNPNRLRIQTFDSLATELTRQMPMLSEVGATPAIEENADALYRKASRATLLALSEAGIGEHLARVLLHLDNRLGQAEDLFCGMLARRDQWLPHVLEAPGVEQLEGALKNEITQRLHALQSALPQTLISEWVRLAGWAADKLPENKQAGNPLMLWAERKQPPAPDWEDLVSWQGLAAVVMTKGGKLRKSWTVNDGFPPPTEKGVDAEILSLRKQAKEDVASLAKQMAQVPGLLDRLAQVSALPMPRFSEQQGALLESLMHCLLRVAAELKLVFAETGKMDFVELGQRALLALGSEQQPTDLALALDYRLKHLLVDEFQDTSSSQHRLLRLLTAGWQDNDGRSLLLVGDPMQSIYRFREAEVGLYLQTRETGLGPLSLTPLTLSMNFRSQKGVVDWVNATFEQLFPVTGDAARGAVPYAHSDAAHPAADFSAVHIHPQLERDDEQEAEQVTRLVEQLQADFPHDSIAILARSRSHLAQIAKQLNARGVDYAAVDVDPLADRPVVQDLRTLTRALLHPADRLSWLSLLRAPWLGLSLLDLLKVAQQPDQSIPKWLHNEAAVATLSRDGQARIQRLVRVLADELPARGRLPLRSWVEGIWLALGGLAIAGTSSRGDAEAFLNALELLEQPGYQLDFAELDQQLGKLYATPDSKADGQLQLMTMHAAKGLEFDSVILPGLGKPPRASDSELLYWAETPDHEGNTQLLMAPIRARREKQEPVSDFIRSLNKEKEQLETVRLLYVAATRARQRLHLFGQAKLNKQNKATPLANSLLNTLWPVVGEAFVGIPPQEEGSAQRSEAIHIEARLAADWQLRLPDLSAAQSEPTATQGQIDFEWAGDTARHVGTLVHRYLERIARQGLDHWPLERLDQLQTPLAVALANLGVEADEMPRAVEKTQRALINTLSHDQGRWILQSHIQHACELPLTVHDEQSRHYIIDRTFVDAEGTRWIIDYKTGEHLDQDTESFLDAEQQRYRDQLDNYARIMRLMEPNPIRLALYFPLHKAWRTWDYQEY